MVYLLLCLGGVGCHAPTPSAVQQITSTIDSLYFFPKSIQLKAQPSGTLLYMTQPKLEGLERSGVVRVLLSPSTNAPQDSLLQLQLVGYQGTQLIRKWIWQGDSTEFLWHYYYQFPIDTAIVATNLGRFEYWYLDGKLQRRVPNIKGQWWLEPEWSTGKHQFWLTDKNTTSDTFELYKTTQHSVLLIQLQLLGGSSGYWSINTIEDGARDATKKLAEHLANFLEQNVSAALKQEPSIATQQLKQCTQQLEQALKKMEAPIFAQQLRQATQSSLAEVEGWRQTVYAEQLATNRKRIEGGLQDAIYALKQAKHTPDDLQNILHSYESTTQGKVTTEMIVEDLAQQHQAVLP